MDAVEVPRGLLLEGPELLHGNRLARRLLDGATLLGPEPGRDGDPVVEPCRGSLALPSLPAVLRVEVVDGVVEHVLQPFGVALVDPLPRERVGRVVVHLALDVAEAAAVDREEAADDVVPHDAQAALAREEGAVPEAVPAREVA